MPTTVKNRDERLTILHQLLKRVRKWKKTELHEAVCEALFDLKISDRTILDDITYLRDVKFAPIETLGKGKSTVYFYNNYGFKLNESTLDTDELYNLELCYNILDQLKEFSIGAELATILGKIKETINEDITETTKTLYFEQSNLQLNYGLTKELINSIKYKTVIKVYYQPFGVVEPFENIVQPFYLKQYNKRWFLIGYNLNEARIEVKALDRIKRIKPTNINYDETVFLAHDIYANNLVGVSKYDNLKAELVTVKVAAIRAMYFETKPILPITAKVINKDKSINYTFLAILNKELEQQILSYGCDIKVLKPKILKLQIKNIVAAMSKNY